MNAVSFWSRGSAAQCEVLPASSGHGSLALAPCAPLSGRPSCKIYPLGRGWALKIERRSAWLIGSPFSGDFRFFRTLAAAIGFAQFHGLDYRIIRPTAFFADHRRSQAKLRRSCKGLSRTDR